MSKSNLKNYLQITTKKKKSKQPPHLRSTNDPVHFEIAPHEREKSHSIDENEEDDVCHGPRVAGLERQAHRELPVVADPEQGHEGHAEGEGPAAAHDVSGVLQRESLVEVHRVRDG